MNELTSDILPPGFDFTDPDLNWSGVPHDQFLALRRTAPIFWVEQPPESRAGMIGAPGYWAITRHEDVSFVSKNSKVFSSHENGAIIRMPEETTRESVEMTQVVIINQDAPDHTALRAIISRGFTPRAINALEDVMEQRARRIVSAAVAGGSGNFVEQVAAELPLEAIAEFLGVPYEDRHKLFEWSNRMIGMDDPEYAGDDANSAAGELFLYVDELAEQRRLDPRDDIATKLINAEIDGDRLTQHEFDMFMVLLAVAGAETTRNATTHLSLIHI